MVLAGKDAPALMASCQGKLLCGISVIVTNVTILTLYPPRFRCKETGEPIMCPGKEPYAPDYETYHGMEELAACRIEKW